MDMDNSVVIAGDRGWEEVREGIKGTNGSGKHTIKTIKKHELDAIIIFLFINKKAEGWRDYQFADSWPPQRSPLMRLSP